MPRRDRRWTRRWALRRAWWATQLPVDCARCGRPITIGMKWDLDHLVPLRDGGTSRDTHPSHAYCNRSHGGRLAHGEADPGVGVPPPRPEVGRVNSRDWFTTPTDPTGTVDKA